MLLLMSILGFSCMAQIFCKITMISDLISMEMRGFVLCLAVGLFRGASQQLAAY